MATDDITHADSPSDPPACTVYYDGNCPLCQREIAFYQRRKGQDAVHWHDVSVSEMASSDLDRNDALKRFHIRRPDGSLVSGAQAFAELLKTLPSLRWLGHLLSIPPISWLAELGYRAFLPIRPLLHRFIGQSATRPRNDAA
ncbi:MAG: DUF393 domain-containing protein [Pseudomonadota bacterium]